MVENFVEPITDISKAFPKLKHIKIQELKIIVVESVLKFMVPYIDPKYFQEEPYNPLDFTDDFFDHWDEEPDSVEFMNILLDIESKLEMVQDNGWVTSFEFSRIDREHIFYSNSINDLIWNIASTIKNLEIEEGEFYAIKIKKEFRKTQFDNDILTREN